MSFSKLAKINGNWKWIVFSEQEEEVIRARHRASCLRIYSECLEDAKKISNEKGILSLSVIEIASALFSKRADAIYSALQKEIDQAICDMQREKK